ncbi:nucleolin 2-like [Rosa rugosa]|uniref:nucleolin 2-like n=1 Tax=Rosa rugosa TaxID=74645 RepID=UPI002B40CE3F|nr:nucleolin 2-like [Rosa rugosa]XP_061995982.1 nucleolin 2-like [Rosa rugosa]
MANQPNTRKRFQTDGKPPTYQETGITGASEHAVLYNEVSNSFWALLDWLISIWRFGFGRQKPSTTVSGNQAVSGNTRDQNGSFPVGNTPRKRARKKVKPNSSNSSTNAKSSPQTQITKDDKPKHDQKPSATVSGNQAVSGNTRDQNGSLPVGNTPQKHAREKVKANSSNSSTNAKSSPPQTQITKDDKPKHDQKPSTTVSGNQAVSGNTRDQNGSFPVGNSSNSSTNVKSSRPPQTQITKDDKPKDVQKPSITVSDNQVSRNTGDDNGRFIVGNAPGKHARKKDKASSSNSSTSARSSRPSQTQISEDDKPEDDRKPCIVVSGNQINDNIGHRNGMFSVGKATGEHAQKKDKASSSNSSTSARSSRPCQTQVSEDDKPEDDRKPCIIVSGNQINDNKGHRNGIFSVGNT